MRAGKVKYKEPRPNQVTISLSDKELQAIDEYCKKYKVVSRSSVIREGAVRFVMKRLIEDGTKLFPDEEDAQSSLFCAEPSADAPRKAKSVDCGMESLFGDDDFSA